MPRRHAYRLSEESYPRKRATGWRNPHAILRIIPTKMKCLPSCLIYNLLAWHRCAPFLARVARVTRVSLRTLSLERAEAFARPDCSKILPTKKYYVRIHTRSIIILPFTCVLFSSILYLYSTIIDVDAPSFHNPRQSARLQRAETTSGAGMKERITCSIYIHCTYTYTPYLPRRMF